MDTTNYSGSVTAIAALIIMVLAKFGLNVQAGDITTVVFGVIALIGLIKQMVDHKNLGQALASARMDAGK